MHAKIWTQDDCPDCEEVKRVLGNIIKEEVPADALTSGEERDVDAMVQLAMQNHALPLVKLDGEFIHPQEILERFSS